MKEVVNDLWLLVRDYAKQETVDPLKALGRFLAWGLAGAFCMCFGLGFATLAIVRALQSHTGSHLTGSFTWVPYLAGIAFAALCAAGFVWSIKRPFRTKETPA